LYVLIRLKKIEDKQWLNITHIVNILET
jgi:hypothetical protein